MLRQLMFADRAAYAPNFTQPDHFQPYVREVCRRHGLPETSTLPNPLPGTHPVFLVGEYVVKFFADLFDGEHSFVIERACYELLQTAPTISAPQLIAAGHLFPNATSWRWPYIISTKIPGTSLSRVYDIVSPNDRTILASDCAHLLRALHTIPLGSTGPLRAERGPFPAWLEHQRNTCHENHRVWGTLPAHLLAQINDYLPSVDALLDQAHPPALLHCDLNADHLLVEQRDAHWFATGVIDFGDARVGDVVYDLVALHLGLFRCDRTLLKAFLQNYGFPNNPSSFVRRAMCFTLLHEFNVLDDAVEHVEGVRQIATLDELAHRIWDVDLQAVEPKA